MTIASTSTGVGSITGGTCDPTGNTRRAGTCTVIVNSNTVGTLTVNASGTVVVGGVTIPVATNGYGAHDVSNVKTYVDARITIGHGRHEPGRQGAHVHGARREERRHRAGRRRAARRSRRPRPVSGSITGGTCGPTGTTNASGTCTVIINSSVPGTTTVNASGTVTVNGVAIPVATSGYGAHDVSNVKLWADATVRTDIHNASHAVVTTVRPSDVVHDKVFVDEVDRHPGLGARTDRQRHVPSVHDDRLHRRHGRPDRRPRSRRHGRDERLHDDERHVVQGGLRRRRELPGTLGCV